jgi:DNA primase catalytic subunit
MHLSTVLSYYKRPEVQQALVENAKEKEIAVSFGGKGYGKRPDTLQYPGDVMAFVKQGVTSFHCSEELWNNPLMISTGAKRKELDKLRRGWDLVLDIDCPELVYSQIAGDLLVQAIKYHGIESVSVKFSGNHGFHIAVPFEAFPSTVHGTPTKDLFPEGPRKIAMYLGEMIREQLRDRLLQFHDIGTIVQRTGREKDELVKNGMLDPFEVLKIDTVLIASRHLYRMPYSFNEKSGLVSIPIPVDKIMAFDKEQAKAENVKVDLKFLERKNIIPNEARKLLINSFDFVVKNTIRQSEKDEYEKTNKSFDVPQEALSENLFPPCIKAISQGLKDGRKRAMFALVNFLQNVGWGHEQIEAYVREWNDKNPEPLRESEVEGHLRYHKQSRRGMLPPNCRSFYEDLGVCHPDSVCNKVKNPVTYTTRRAWFINLEQKDVKKTNKEEQKEDAR